MQAEKLPVVCLAPPITDEMFAKYQAIIDALPADQRMIRDAMANCMKCVKSWDELPVSQRADVSRYKAIAGGREVDLVVTPLEKDHVETLWDVTPYLHEIPPTQQLFDELPTGAVERNGENVIVDQAAADLRNAAFHLLWHVIEIAHDREPMTNDKLPAA